MTYTVQPGDSLSKIAQKFYGNAFLYNRILDANPQIVDENVIQVGQVLEIPGVGTQAPVSTPAPAPAPVALSVEKPEMTKTVMIIFAVAAAALGYLVMKNMTKRGAPLAAANPKRKRRKKNSKKRPEDFLEMDEEIVEEDE